MRRTLSLALALLAVVAMPAAADDDRTHFRRTTPRATLEEEAGKDRSLRHDLATAYMRVADIQGKVNRANMGKPAEAMSSFEAALAIQVGTAKAGKSSVTIRHARRASCENSFVPSPGARST